MNDFADLGLADRNQLMLDALEFVDPAIQERSLEVRSPWRNLIPRGSYQTGAGLVRKIHQFFPGMGDMRGLNKWRPIKVSSQPTTTNPGYDACATNPYLVKYGFQTVEYSGIQTERRTPHICINDWKWTWEFEQQIGLIMGFLGDVANSVWENLAREMYMKIASDEGAGYVMVGGVPTSVTFTYDPYSVDTDGDNTITLTIAEGDVSRIDSWKPFRWISRYMGLQCPMGALSNVNGKPNFGLVGDLEDIQDMIEKNPELREDYRFFAPDVLVNNYGSVTSFKGFNLMDDLAEPRFAIKSRTSTTVTLKRIDPFIETDLGAKGVRYDVNEDYLNAEFAIKMVLVKDSYSIEVPPAGPEAPGGGTSFGATPGLNGERYWVNIPNEKTNLLSESGFYLMRFQGFVKPGANAEHAKMILHRRCPTGPVAKCESCGDAAASASTAVVLARACTSADASADLKTLTVVLSKPLGCEVGDEVTLANVSNGDQTTALIAESVNAPTYKLVFTTAIAAATNYGATVTVTCA